MPIFHALEQSLNLATLHLAREIGLANIAKTFEGFGIVDQMPPYYPSAIGAIDTTLWRMATGYAEIDQYGRQGHADPDRQRHQPRRLGAVPGAGPELRELRERRSRRSRRCSPSPARNWPTLTACSR